MLQRQLDYLVGLWC